MKNKTYDIDTLIGLIEILKSSKNPDLVFHALQRLGEALDENKEANHRFNRTVQEMCEDYNGLEEDEPCNKVNHNNGKPRL